MPGNLRPIAYAFAAVSALWSCGQDPSFIEKTSKSIESTAGGSSSSGEDDATAAGGTPSEPSVADASGQTSPNEEEQKPASASVADGSGYNFPGLDPSDAAALNRCLAKWKDVPFPKTINSVRKIYAQINILGFGTQINDTAKTPEPELILLYSSVNVGGKSDMTLMNPNGYYCLKAGVNVKQDLTVNLDCHAHLADSLVDVNVNSPGAVPGIGVGVSVNSSTKVVPACAQP